MDKNFPDRVKSEDLPDLTHEELLSLYQHRRDRTDDVFSILMGRAAQMPLVERRCQQQEKLLIECYHLLANQGATPTTKRLEDLFEYYGVVVDKQQSAEQAKRGPSTEQDIREAFERRGYQASSHQRAKPDMVMLNLDKEGKGGTVSVSKTILEKADFTADEYAESVIQGWKNLEDRSRIPLPGHRLSGT